MSVNSDFSTGCVSLPEGALRVGFCIGLSLSTVLFFVIWGDTKIAVLVAASCAISAALVVQRANRGRPHSKLITLFFWLAGAHAVLGYWAARNSSDAIWIGTTAELAYRQAIFIVADTLFIASLSYALSVRSEMKPIFKFWNKGRISEPRLLMVARICTLLGVGCVLYVILTAGYMPLLAANPGQARYISDELGPKYREYAFVMDKGRDLLACAVPLVLFAGVVRSRKADWLAGLVGVLALAVTLDRAHILALFAVLLLTINLMTGSLPRTLLGLLLLLICSYFALQLVFLNAIGDNSDKHATQGALLSGFPEVRDLGWTISLLREQRYEGLTFVQPFLLGYWTAPEFKEHYGLGNITARLIGVPRSDTGGLRITLAGEGYVNFGGIGCMIIGVAFGFACSWLSRLAASAARIRDLASSYLLAIAFSWLCFWLYLAGTEATGVVKNGISVVLVMFMVARIKQPQRGAVASGGRQSLETSR